MRQLSGKYSEIEFIKSDNGETVGRAHRLPDGQLACGAPALQPQDSTRAVKLNSREWDQTVQKLAATFNKSSASKATVFARNGGRQSATQRFATAAGACESLPIGTLSSLQEDEDMLLRDRSNRENQRPLKASYRYMAERAIGVLAGQS